MTVRRAAATALLASFLLAGVPSAAGAAEDPTPTTSEAPATTVPQATDAQDTGPATGVRLVPPGSGIDGMIPPSMLRPNGDQPTLLEATNPDAYTWDGRYGTLDSDGVVALLSDGLLRGLVWIGVVVTRTTSWVFDMPQIDGNPITALVNQLRDNLFFTWAAIAVLVVAIWAMVQAVRVRAIEALSHIGWCLVVGAMSVALMAVPGKVIETVNRGTTQFARMNMAAASTLDPGTDLADGTTTRGTFSGDPAVSAVRRTTDMWWRMYVVKPWAMGQFGRTDAPLPAGTIDRTLLLKSGTMTEAALTPEELDAMSGKVKVMCMVKDNRSVIGKLIGSSPRMATEWEAVLCMRQQAWEALRDQTAQIPGVQPWLDGERQYERLAIGGGGILAALLTGGLMAGLAIACQWYLLKGTLLLAFAGPYGLVGIVPDDGQGRAGAQAYLQLWADIVWTYMRVIICATALGVMLVLMSVVGQWANTKGWAWSIMVHLAVIGLLLYRYLKRRHRQGRSLLPHPVRAARRQIATAKATVTGGARRVNHGLTRAHVMASGTLMDGQLLDRPVKDRRTRPARPARPTRERYDRNAGWDDQGPVQGPPSPDRPLGVDRAHIRGALNPAPVVREHGGPEPMAIGERRAAGALGPGPRVHTAGAVPTEREAIPMGATSGETADRVQGRFPDRRVIDTVARRVK